MTDDELEAALDHFFAEHPPPGLSAEARSVLALLGPITPRVAVEDVAA